VDVDPLEVARQALESGDVDERLMAADLADERGEWEFACWLRLTAAPGNGDAHVYAPDAGDGRVVRRTRPPRPAASRSACGPGICGGGGGCPGTGGPRFAVEVGNDVVASAWVRDEA
jgi:hypothetical protein